MMHPDALWDVIEARAQARTDRPKQQQNIAPLGFDEASIAEAVRIAPGLQRIRSV
jgi:hypothetical protein